MLKDKLIAIIPSIGKAAVKGFGHWIMRTISVLVILGIAWAIYVTMVKPHTNPTPTTTQQADEITNTYITESDDSFFAGLKLFGFKIGISKLAKTQIPVISQNK